MTNVEMLSRFSHFILSTTATCLIIEATSQKLLAAKVSLEAEAPNEKKHGTASSLATSFQGLNISDDVISASSIHNLDLNLTQTVTPNLKRNGKPSSVPLDNNLQDSNISHRAADLRLQPASTSVEGMTQAQLLASEVDLNILCQKYPRISRCAEYKPSSERQRQQEAIANPRKQSSGYAVTGKVSTLGIGIEGTGAILPNLNGRLGFNYFDFGVGIEAGGIDYDADVQLLSGSALLDWFPSRRSEFHLTSGLFYQNNRVDATARLADDLDIGGIRFPSELVGQLEGKATLPNTFAPYVGIGYGNPVKRGRQFSFFIDLGIVFTGSPAVDLTASGPLIDPVLGAPVIGPLLTRAIALEETDIEDDLSGLSVFPVLSIGASYRF